MISVNRYIWQTSVDPQTVWIPSNLYLMLVSFHIVETDVSFLIDLKHISGEADEPSLLIYKITGLKYACFS